MPGGGGGSAPEGVAVVRVEVLAVLLVGEDDVAGRVQRRLDVNAGAVGPGAALLALVALWQLVLGRGRSDTGQTVGGGVRSASLAGCSSTGTSVLGVKWCK